jgi:hypothetical protein
MEAGMRRIRFLRWVAPIALIAGLPFVGVPWGHAEGEPNRPPQFSGQAFASAVHVTANPVPTPFVAEVGRADVPQGSSSWDDSGAAKGQAATYYPGVGVTGGGALLCSAGVPCPAGFPPPFPFMAQAQYPNQPDASVASGQENGDDASPLHARAGQAVAHAGPDKVTTSATIQGLTIAGTSASSAAALSFRRTAAALLRGPAAAATVRPAANDAEAVRVDSLTATTSQGFDDAGTLVSSAASVLRGVQLMGGTVTIDTIRTTSVSKIDLDGKEPAVNDSVADVSGVLVAGQPATIDNNGITVGANPSQGGDVAKALNDAFQKALSQAGAEVVLLSASKTVNSSPDGASSQGTAAGVYFGLRAGNPSIPGPANMVETSVQLGQAGTMASASSRAADGSGDLTAPIDDITGGLPDNGAVGTGSPGDSGSLSGTGNVPSPPTTAKDSSAKRAQVALERPTKASLTGGPIVEGLRVLYLVMTIACLAVSLGSRAVRNRLFRRGPSTS